MVAIRDAKPDDAEVAVDVVRRSITELCPADHHGDAKTVDQWLANKTSQNFRSWLTDGNNFCAIAEVNARLVGVGLLRRTGEIALFYLAPGMQRRGIGKALHVALEQKAMGWGLEKLHLDSTALARPFYEALGYRATDCARPRFGVLCCYPYEKTLQPGTTIERDAPQAARPSS